jgi:Cu/Ag efflux protein CusF
MKSFSKWLSALAAFVLLAGTAMAADAIVYGKVKTVNADKKELVLSDSTGKDWTFSLSDNLVINRDGKESKSDLKAGEAVNMVFDKGVVTWTARYILVTEGDSKNFELMRGTVKRYDADKKQLSFTDEHDKEWTFAMGDAKVRLNKEDSKVEGLKIGDNAIVIVEKKGDNATLKSLMAERK